LSNEKKIFVICAKELVLIGIVSGVLHKDFTLDVERTKPIFDQII